MRRVITVIVIIWLVIGAVAAGQRGYYSGDETDCTGLGTTAVTILAGVLNYVGLNPKVTDCDLPEPSE